MPICEWPSVKAEKRVSGFRVLRICTESRLEERVEAPVSVSFFIGTVDEVAINHAPATNETAAGD